MMSPRSETMNGSMSPLLSLSGDIAHLAAGAAGLVATIGGRAGGSAILWQPDLLVTSEQTLGKGEELPVILPGGGAGTGRLVGRDPGTNVALLRVEGLAAPARPATAEPVLGGIALALGGDGSGGVSVRLGLVGQLGPAWHSQAGGRIDRRIILDAAVSGSVEGGPVIDAAGCLLGMSTLGPRRRALVIPTATLERAVATLLAYGRVARGWLGVGLQPVAVPEELRESCGQATGLMVLGLSAGSPAAAAGVMQGDVLLTVDGQPVARPRALAERFGPESIGSEVLLQLLRASRMLTVRATIGARP